MHVTFEDILAQAVELGQGWREALVELASGDTLWCPASSKKVIKGRGRYRFLIHPSQVMLDRAPAGCRYIPA